MNAAPRWSIEKANEWYSRQPWLVGCNFIPSNAINQLEMWQVETFDPVTIQRELGWAASLGFNTVRTYLHDLAWEADPEGFKRRIHHFLQIASSLGIRPVLVFFDDCWNADPKLGVQPVPRPGIHNSGWVQSPGVEIVNGSPSAWGRLEHYVSDVLRSFATDERVLLWDLYNEPGNGGNGDNSLPLVQAVFQWARAVDPSQPLTAGIWWEFPQLNEFQLAASDVITFHNYRPADNLESQIATLKAHGRPLICTEWLARACDSLVSTNLPVFARERVGCFNWGLVAGKTNTIFPWKEVLELLNSPASLELAAEPPVWFHDLFRLDGTPYDLAEIELFRKYTSARERTVPAE